MNCRRTTHLLSLRMDRPLSLSERLVLWSHLPLCSPCQRFGRQLEALRKVMRDDDDAAKSTVATLADLEHPRLSEDVRERLQALLDRES